MKVFGAFAFIAALVVAQTIDNGEKRLIALSDDDQRWLTKSEIDDLIENNIGFADATNGDWDSLQLFGFERAQRPENKTYPAGPVHENLVRAIQANVTPLALEKTLTEFVTKFANRHKLSAEGKASSTWLFNQASALKPVNPNIKYTVRRFEHNWTQASVIARIEPISGQTAN
ncbi:hypothetical protein DYB28_005961, partial [Aphanomyces astaci]